MTSYVLGIDFGGTKVALTAGYVGEGLPSSVMRIETRGSEGALAVVDRTIAACRSLVRETPGDLIAVGVSTFGIVRDGVVRLAPNVPGWDGLPLPSLLRSSFDGVPVSVTNDVKAATAAELQWGALAGVSNGIYLNLGTGLAAGFVVNGQVVTGAHGAAGEIAYILRSPGDLAAGGAPLEETISGAALASRGSALLGRSVSAAELFALADTDGVRTLLDEALDALAVAVVNMCVTLDPSCVVIGGGLMGASSEIMPRLVKAVERAVPYPPEIVPARFVDDAPLYGALALAQP